jgi:hypothetical protein
MYWDEAADFNTTILINVDPDLRQALVDVSRAATGV